MLSSSLVFPKGDKPSHLVSDLHWVSPAESLEAFQTDNQNHSHCPDTWLKGHGHCYYSHIKSSRGRDGQRALCVTQSLLSEGVLSSTKALLIGVHFHRSDSEAQLIFSLPCQSWGHSLWAIYSPNEGAKAVSRPVIKTCHQSRQLRKQDLSQNNPNGKTRCWPPFLL